MPVTLTMTDACATCGGTGAEPGATMTTCDECKRARDDLVRSGRLRGAAALPGVSRPRQGPVGKCHACSGSGEQRTEKQMLITVPPATETGTRVRLKGQGPRAKAGGPASDILVTFTVEADTLLHARRARHLLRDSDLALAGDARHDGPREDGRVAPR